MYARLTSATNATISCTILVKIGPVVSAENILIEIALCVYVVVRHMSSNISGYTGPIFAIILPCESALHANDGAVLQKRNASINKRYRNARKSLRKRIRIMYEIA